MTKQITRNDVVEAAAAKGIRVLEALNMMQSVAAKMGDESNSARSNPKSFSGKTKGGVHTVSAYILSFELPDNPGHESEEEFDSVQAATERAESLRALPRLVACPTFLLTDEHGNEVPV